MSEKKGLVDMTLDERLTKIQRLDDIAGYHATCHIHAVREDVLIELAHFQDADVEHGRELERVRIAELLRHDARRQAVKGNRWAAAEMVITADELEAGEVEDD